MSVVSAAYIRVSTEDQIEFSPASQRKRIEEYATAHDMQILTLINIRRSPR